MSTKKGTGWITIRRNRKVRNEPHEIRIDSDGKVFIDGELFDENSSKYKNLSISVERHSKVNTGEETRKMIEQSKKAKPGDTEVITDITDPSKTERTVVRY
jgi:hypothetical protein